MSASASALMLGWHDAIGALASDTPRQANSVAQGAYRIRELRLSTAIPLARMATYYREVLGFGVKRPTEGTLVVQAGTTKLRFTRSDASDEETPWYHFAFDVPKNRLFEARTWLLERTKLKPRRPGPGAHSDYPDVAWFPHWNAHSVFFWDPAGNLLEYIARHTVDNASDEPFSPKSVIAASEIGLMAKNVHGTAREVRAATGLAEYAGTNERFYPIGDPYGLVIVFEAGHGWQMSDGSRRPTRAYPTGVILTGESSKTYASTSYPYRIEVSPRSE